MLSKILLTGGSGDLGRVLTPMLLDAGYQPLRLDIRPPADNHGHYLEGSILDRQELSRHLEGVDLVVHIAAWHGIHEATRQKKLREFVELNVIGSFNVLDACAQVGIQDIVNISSTSVDDDEGIYGPTKRMGEKMAQSYADLINLKIITLRPRAFIPHWNTAVYSSFVDWAKWFWQGAVHIDDVANAVMLAIGALLGGKVAEHQILPLDSKYEYSDEELANWDADGPASSFKHHYARYFDLAISQGLNPALRPRKLDISQTISVLGYRPNYSLLNLLQELDEYGPAGPPPPA